MPVESEEDLHRLLKFSFCYHYRTDLFQESYILDGHGKPVLGKYPFSLSFDKLNHEDTTLFIKFVGEWCEKKLGATLQNIVEIEKGRGKFQDIGQ